MQAPSTLSNLLNQTFWSEAQESAFLKAAQLILGCAKV